MRVPLEAWMESLRWTLPNLPDSTVWLRGTNVLCALGIAACLGAMFAHGLQSVRARSGSPKGDRSGPLPALALVVLMAATAAVSVSVGYRWIEVNHFPSQTMSEVLVMFSLALLFSQVVLHFALGLRRIGPGWAMLADGIALFVFLGAWGVNVYSTSLTTAQRDLPPALQSYWFPFHLSALIFSYATLAIAALISCLFFVVRLWGSLFGGQAKAMSVQFACIVAIGALWLAAVWLALNANLPAWAGLSLVAAVVGGSLWAARRWLAPLFAGSGLLPVWMLLLIVAVSPTLGKGGQYLLQALVLMIALVGVAFALVWFLHRRAGEGWTPSAAGLAAIEKDMDQVSFRAFSVGFPFLTAGLFMGAFWAQEAWANYWGWDSKENSALITWLVYVVYIHLRMLGGYRGAKAMSVLMGGAISILITFQLFGYFPDSQKSLHRYTDDNVVPQEGLLGPSVEESARNAAGAEPAVESARLSR